MFVGLYCIHALRESYDKIHKRQLGLFFSIYRIIGELTKVNHIFSGRIDAYCRVCRENSEEMKVCVGLRESCVMSLWMFNILMVGVMKEGTERTFDKGVT